MLNSDRPGRLLASSADRSLTSLCANVAGIGPRVHGDAVRTGGQAGLGGFHHARDAQVARVADQATLLRLTDSEVVVPEVLIVLADPHHLPRAQR